MANHSTKLQELISEIREAQKPQSKDFQYESSDRDHSAFIGYS
jgi:hypothetical protein